MASTSLTVITSLHEIDLAEKVADKIVTVKGSEVFGYGSAEEIFEEENIRKLYNIDNGFFDPLLGNIELQKPDGKEPKVFVIAGGGNGILRQLRAAGIDYKKIRTMFVTHNHTDHVLGAIWVIRLARLYATDCITCESYGDVSESDIKKALDIMAECEYVIAADEGSSGSKANRILLDEAVKTGKLKNR